MEVEELKTMYLALAGARVKHHFIFGVTSSSMLVARVLTFQNKFHTKRRMPFFSSLNDMKNEFRTFSMRVF